MNINIFHGTGSTPNDFWLPWISNRLRENGHQTWVPALPQSDNPQLNIWLPFALQNGNYNEDTILIGHSAGCPLVLSILEQLNIKVRRIILVAGFISPLAPTETNPILKTSYNWEKIKNNTKSTVIINSDNDPWGCNDHAGREIFDKIGGTQIILKGQGHMGSSSFNQPYREFPLLLDLVESTAL